MSRLKNAVNIAFPPLDERARAHITVSAEYDLPVEQKPFFQGIIWAVAEPLDAKELSFPQHMGITCIFPQKAESNTNGVGLIRKGKTTLSVDLTPPAATDDLTVLF